MCGNNCFADIAGRCQWALVCAMVAFAVASAGEIGLHIQQRWMYFNLVPGFANVVFYSGLTLGQVLLALGIGGIDLHIVGDCLAVSFSVGYQLKSAIVSVNEPLPQSNIVVAHWLLWTITFGTLTIFGAVPFVIKICRLKGAPTHAKVFFTLAMLASYAVGIFCSMKMTSGEQLWHVPTASGFLVGFAVQVWWMYATMTDADQSADKHATMKRAQHAHCKLFNACWPAFAKRDMVDGTILEELL